MPLVVFGAGHDVIPLVKFAKELGWHVTVADGRAKYAQAGRFPQADRIVLLGREDLLAGIEITRESMIMLMTHNYPMDVKLVQQIAWEAALPRIARARSEKLLAEAGQPLHGVDVHGPVGLDLGSDTPEAIAFDHRRDSGFALRATGWQAEVAGRCDSRAGRRERSRGGAGCVDFGKRGLRTGMKCGVILLAAGSSTRMGEPKQLMDYHGNPLVRHAVDTALASVCRPVIVVLGANAAAIGRVVPRSTGGDRREPALVRWHGYIDSNWRAGGSRA